jgi:hypothetical protein
MLYANKINDQVTLGNNANELANYDELLDNMCTGEIIVGNMTMVSDGIVIWNENECEIDFIEFRC